MVLVDTLVWPAPALGKTMFVASVRALAAPADALLGSPNCQNILRLLVIESMWADCRDLVHAKISRQIIITQPSLAKLLVAVYR